MENFTRVTIMIRRYFSRQVWRSGLPLAPLAQKPKSVAEQKALQAMFAATDPDVQIAAANTVIEKFADTDFKSIALFFIARDYQVKGDFAKSVTYGERSLEADPKNYQAMLVVAERVRPNTKDTDFDKEDKLRRPTSLPTTLWRYLKTRRNRTPTCPMRIGTDAKKDMSASAYEILGQSAMVRKKPEVAAAAFPERDRYFDDERSCHLCPAGAGR